MKLGVDNLLAAPDLLKQFEGSRVALLGHQASLTTTCQHTMDVLMACSEIDVTCAFGPQHGMYGEKQDNMIESDDYIDPRYGIPVFSLYGKTRVPTPEMMSSFDVLVVDLQDIGTRIYTYLTTLVYFLKAAADDAKRICILDRPNPAGRPVEGSILEAGWESFIGPARLIMRHGLTLGEFASWFVSKHNLNVDLKVIPMTGYDLEAGPGFGWPLHELAWTNPSPNASSLNMTRCFPGTVLFEGTTLSEGRGTTTPLELVGAPDIDFDVVHHRMTSLQPEWLQGCFLRRCYFEPAFQKHVGKVCSGLQIHTDQSSYRHEHFRPYRLAALILKAIRLEYPGYELWHDLPYEYETERLAIDLLSGGTFLRTWVDDPGLCPDEFDARLKKDEQEWLQAREPFLLY